MFGLCKDPVEDFGDLCVVGFVIIVGNEVEKGANNVSIFVVGVVRNGGYGEIIHFYAKGIIEIFNFFSCVSVFCCDCGVSCCSCHPKIDTKVSLVQQQGQRKLS